MKLERLGDAAFRWEIDDATDRRSLGEGLRALEGVIDAVVTERHAGVVVRPDGAFDPSCLEHLATRRAPEPREHVIAVRYDGADLDEVATRAGTSPDEVVRLHAARTYTVSFVGFLPGFGYLREVDPRIAIPRRATPRTRVPKGAVGIAAGYTGVYPFASPGGWNLVGTAVGFSAFDPARGATLALGDRVRFEHAR
jgi:UPF0271 protein